MSNLNYVGKSVIRQDSFDKARGATKYICDMEKHNMLYGKLLLSEKPHANIEIDTSEALKVKGIAAIFTHEDVPKVKYNSHRWYEGVNDYDDEYIINEKSRFVGDRIALVLGESMDSVKRAIKKIKVTYTELPSVITIEDAKKDDVRIHDRSNLAFQKVLSCGNYEDACKNADYIIEDTGETQKIHHSAIEPHSCLSEVDENGNLVVWTPCQVVTQIQYQVSHCLGIPYDKVRVIKSVMGGSFGGKGESVLEPVCAFASYKLNRPVKLVMDRSDAILATRVRNPVKMNVKTAISKDGRILGREINAEIDGGAYYTNASAIVMSLGKKVFRLYDIKDQYYSGSTYYTNTLIGGACRGYGSPQLHAITEINIDNAAKKINMDPCEFRLKNVIKPGMKDPIGGPDIGNGKVKECIESGMKEFNWAEKRKNVASKNDERYSYGVGMACGVHGNGYKGAYPDFTDVLISINRNGRVSIKIGIHDQGCGTITTLQQIASETLDLPLENIAVTEADTFLTPYDSAGTQASRVTFVCGGAVKFACDKLKETLIEDFCKIKNIHPSTIKIKKGFLYVNSSEKYSLGDVALMVEKELHKSLSEYVHYESPGNPGSYAACFAEVKVDKFTGLVEILEFIAVHDIGQSINPMLVEGQIQGGAHFSIGMALYEDIVMDKHGYVKSKNFSKYHLINAPIMPEVKVITIEDNEPYGPYGAKSVGEMAAVCPAPAIVNAINHALGTNITTYPVKPEVIVRSLGGF